MRITDQRLTLQELQVAYIKGLFEDIAEPVEYTADTFIADIDLSETHQATIRNQGCCDKAHHFIGYREWQVD